MQLYIEVINIMILINNKFKMKKKEIRKIKKLMNKTNYLKNMSKIEKLKHLGPIK